MIDTNVMNRKRTSLRCHVIIDALSGVFFGQKGIAIFRDSFEIVLTEHTKLKPPEMRGGRRNKLVFLYFFRLT
jgi:hypothetical protein